MGGRWRAWVTRAERAVGRWAPPAGFVVVALVLASAPWLRPPLSRDVSAFHLPLMPAAAAPEEWLTGDRPVIWDSPGVLLAAVAGVGGLMALARPRRFGAAAGVLLAAALAANAALLLNHPELVEVLDREQEQRGHVARVIGRSPEQNSLTNARNGRVVPPEDGPVCELARGTEYLRYGPWLVGWAAAGVFLGTAGSPGRRLGAVAGWAAAGAGLTAVLCLPRLHAESHWAAAEWREAEGDVDGARRAIEQSAAVFPEFARLERTWRLAGAIDFRAGADTPQARYFRAEQLARRQRWVEALAVTGELRGGADAGHPAVRAQAARLYAAAGLDEYALGPAYTDAGPATDRQDRHLAGAYTAWRRGLAADPGHWGCAISLGLLEARLNPGRPDLVEARLGPLLPALGDRVIRADLLATLGDAHLEAGDAAAARRRYAESFRAFNLPTAINYRAQKGLGGW